MFRNSLMVTREEFFLFDIAFSETAPKGHGLAGRIIAPEGCPRHRRRDRLLPLLITSRVRA
jgi:hypothetical protein